MASVYERITNALSSLGKRRERDNEDGGRDNRLTPGEKGRTPKRYRPWEQSDLHRRLETFKPLTWFGKPETVGPVPCALRGWINNSKDSLSCEHCNAKLIYPPNISYQQQQAAADLFSPNLATKHNFTCPWRSTACNTSLLAYIPPNNSEELCQMFQTLQGKLLKVDVLPEVDLIAIQALRNAAVPYGSYDELVMGPGGGALTPVHKSTPAVRIKDVTDEPYGVQDSSAPLLSDIGLPLNGAAVDDTPTFLLQPSKMTPLQKARLLALMGWDLDVLQPESASGSAALLYTQSAGYGLGHLGVKPKTALKGGSGEGAAAADDKRYPMSSVVLKCPHCNCRTGLWNFAGLRPVPTGRLTPSQHPAGASALLSPTSASTPTAPGGAAGTTSSAAGVDPLSVTIAGGQYGLHGTARIGSTASRPFGATSSAPFRFGSASSTEPVFGIAALEVKAQKSKGDGSSSTPTPAAGGFGSPLGGGGGAASTPEPRRTGQKRKAGEPFTPEPMAVDVTAAAQTPTPGPSGGVASNLTDSKRLRLGSYTSGGGTSLTGGRAQTPAGDVRQLPELDPVGQHRNWCPWIYTGTREEPHISGWQHMLRALSIQQQQQAAAAAAAAAAASPPAPAPAPADGPPAASGVIPMDTTPAFQAAVPTATGGGASAVDARRLKDSALAAIRKL
ncbi:hypothetical protein VaNZ11_015523 [Volvox africanus]|uniref:C3HC-type domain-containing protein n=1 Tax=Volvox africanus TaxID=51714 RepID=A0ABQ5SKS0_9CHLO|nr:hypothetical protein VaNZ11_015523 [Volvox africanus]